jgi:MOSC domain-containing protein YiiM
MLTSAVLGLEDAQSSWNGIVTHLQMTPRAFLPMRASDSLKLIADFGVEGDRYANATGFYSDKPEPGRQVTLFEEETLEALRRDHGIEFLHTDHRRNITTRGVPLNHLVGRQFRVGSVVLEATRLSVPCKHVEETSGKEVFNALINRSGLNARILQGGIVAVGDLIVPLDQ